METIQDHGERGRVGKDTTVYIKLSVGEEPSFMIRSRAATVSVSPYVYQFCRIKIPTPNQETICNCQERKNSFSLIEYQWVYQLFSRAGPMFTNSWSKQSRLHGVCTHMYLYFCYILFSLTFSAVSFFLLFFFLKKERHTDRSREERENMKLGG